MGAHERAQACKDEEILTRGMIQGKERRGTSFRIARRRILDSLTDTSSATYNFGNKAWPGDLVSICNLEVATLHLYSDDT